MTSAHLQQWIEHPECLDRGTLYELRTLVARYPYFQSLRLLYLKNLYLLHDASFGSELRKAVLYVADRRVLFHLIEAVNYVPKPVVASLPVTREREEELGVDRTLFLIDTFLASLPEEQALGTELDYAMDYTPYLMEETGGKKETEERETDVPELKGQALIDGFLQREADGMTLDATDEAGTVSVAAEKNFLSEKTNDKEQKYTAATDGYGLDDGCFTETLAKIYIKQHRYEKALEIIKKLSLNYPKKNAYFADQIRFLEKLIINAKSK